jgi:hypothetical protein
MYNRNQAFGNCVDAGTFDALIALISFYQIFQVTVTTRAEINGRHANCIIATGEAPSPEKTGWVDRWSDLLAEASLIICLI